MNDIEEETTSSRDLSSLRTMTKIMRGDLEKLEDIVNCHETKIAQHEAMIVIMRELAADTSDKIDRLNDIVIDFIEKNKDGVNTIIAAIGVAVAIITFVVPICWRFVFNLVR